MAQSTPLTVVNSETVRIWLEALYNAVKQPKGSVREKIYGPCRDSGVAAIGKIIKTHASVFNPRMAICFWIHFIPLKFNR